MGVGVEISVVFPLLKTNLGCNSLIFLEPLCNLVFECCYGVQILYIYFNLDEEIWLIFSPSMLLYSVV